MGFERICVGAYPLAIERRVIVCEYEDAPGSRARAGVTSIVQAQCFLANITQRSAGGSSLRAGGDRSGSIRAPVIDDDDLVPIGWIVQYLGTIQRSPQ